jgi:hypothetical protein
VSAGKKPSWLAVAALVEARRANGFLPKYGTNGKGAYEAYRLGLAEDVGHGYELNLRGQDLADDAIRLGKEGPKS